MPVSKQSASVKYSVLNCRYGDFCQQPNNSRQFRHPDLNLKLMEPDPDPNQRDIIAPTKICKDIEI